MCNQNCNQGRLCDCGERKISIAIYMLIVGSIMFLLLGASEAIVKYIFCLGITASWQEDDKDEEFWREMARMNDANKIPLSIELQCRSKCIKCGFSYASSFVKNGLCEGCR